MKKKAALLCIWLFCAAMTGCRDREAEFLKEAEAEETAAAEEKAQENTPVPSEPPKATEPPEKREIYVDVCGAVAEPGVFCLPEGSRVFQAIEAAGGFLPEAAENYVNRAQGLSDGEQLYVPTKEEALTMERTDAVSSGEEKDDAPEGGTEHAGKVNLNTADETELCTLTGIGASKAKAIIAYREENGPFASIEDLMKVEGIKEGTFHKIKDEIEVG